MISVDHIRRLLQRSSGAVRQEGSWLRSLLSRDPRKAARHAVDGGIVAYYYWDGGAPAAHPVRDISTSGLYVKTDARWFPGTLVKMTLQTVSDSSEASCIEVQARVVRWDSNGLALTFTGDAEDVSPQRHPLAPGVNLG